ncbi:hypothetical protein ENBRE01_0905 [Enteropsectra breve]|nr:hypothetical protein ENBRE01_0905 [Enteropsectra breve]
MEIKLSPFKTHMGSAEITKTDKICITTVDIDNRMEARGVDLRFKYHINARPVENFVSAMMKNLLMKYIVEDNNSYSILVYANTNDYGMIFNCIVMGCISAGLPLRKLVCGVGEDCLLVKEESELKLVFARGEVNEPSYEKEASYNYEQMRYGMRTMYDFSTYK